MRGQRGYDAADNGLTGLLDFFGRDLGFVAPHRGLLTPGYWRTALQACGGVWGWRLRRALRMSSGLMPTRAGTRVNRTPLKGTAAHRGHTEHAALG
jgi:hypothetical protein